MTLEHAMQLVDCPREAFEPSGWGEHLRHRTPAIVAARFRVFAAMRCNWHGHPVAGMSGPYIAYVCGIGSHSTVLTSLKRTLGSTEPAACKAWLDKWAGYRANVVTCNAGFSGGYVGSTDAEKADALGVCDPVVPGVRGTHGRLGVAGEGTGGDGVREVAA